MFVRYVSHEIRTPLSAVVLGLNYLKKQSESTNSTMDQNTIDVVEEVRMSCEAAVDILNDVLTYEKLDGGLLQTYFKHEPAFDFIRNATKPFNQQARSLGMDFNVEVQLFKGRRSVRLNPLKDRSLLREANERSLFRMRSAKIVNVSSHSGNNIYPLGSNANGDQSVVEDYSINIDKQKISQVVRNLLSNALKFTPKG
eukprot:gene36536-biopygen8986